MAKNVLGSSTSYTGDASTSLFSISFALGTINVDQIKVYLDDVLKTNIIDYTIVNNDSQVQFTTAPATGATIDIRREQDDNSLEVDYQDTKQIKEKNLDNSNKALYYLLHELFDGWLGKRFKLRANLNANNNQINNISDATAFTDVPSWQQVLDIVNGGTVVVANFEYDSVNAMKAVTSITNGVIVQTRGFYSNDGIGSAIYVVQTALEYNATPDEYRDHTLANGNIAVLIPNGMVKLTQLGAVPITGTDNTAVIQAALDLQVFVQVEEGTYDYTQIEIKRGSGLIGVGADTCLFKCTSIASGASSIFASPNATASLRVENIRIDNITIYGSSVLGSGIDWSSIARSTMRDCIIKDFPESGFQIATHPTTYSASYYNTFVNNIIRDNGKNVRFYNGGLGSGNTNTFIGGQMNAGTTHNVHIEGNPTNVSFFGVAMEGTPTYMVQHAGTGGGVQFNACRFEGASANGIVIETTARDTLFISNTVSGGTPYSNKSTTSTVVGNTGISDVQFQGDIYGAGDGASRRRNIALKKTTGQTTQALTIKDETDVVKLENTFGALRHYGTLAETVYSTQVIAEAQQRYRIDMRGQMSYGDGTTTPTTAFRRYSDGILQFDYDLRLDGTWDGSHMRLGANHLWVDTTGDLRIKNSAPTSDTDGTIVGTQT